MPKENLYDYVSLPDREKRIKIRNDYFNFIMLSVQNKDFNIPINIDLGSSTIHDVLTPFHMQRVREYSCAINDELLALDFFYTALIHTYDNYLTDQRDGFYRQFLKLFAEAYVSKFVSIYMKVFLTVINITDVRELHTSDKMKFGSSYKMFKDKMKKIRQHCTNYPTLDNLCKALEKMRNILLDSGFEEIRNNAIHNISNFDSLVRFSHENEYGALVTGAQALSSFSQVIENKDVCEALSTLMENYQKLLEEIVSQYKEVLS